MSARTENAAAQNVEDGAVEDVDYAADAEDVHYDEEGGEEGEELGEDMEFEDPLAIMGEIFVTEEGETIAEVLSSMRDSLDKGVKVMYRLVQLLESQGAPAEKKEKVKRVT
jgi:hypothetical protein